MIRVHIIDILRLRSIIIIIMYIRVRVNSRGPAREGLAPRYCGSRVQIFPYTIMYIVHVLCRA